MHTQNMLSILTPRSTRNPPSSERPRQLALSLSFSSFFRICTHPSSFIMRPPPPSSFLFRGFVGPYHASHARPNQLVPFGLAWHTGGLVVNGQRPHLRGHAIARVMSLFPRSVGRTGGCPVAGYYLMTNNSVPRLATRGESDACI
jgi:hypothetical protein